MLVKTYGSAVYGINANIITIETDVSRGIRFNMVGLADLAVRESQQRIDAALRFNGYSLPGKKTVINMAPANIRKEGSAYDLPIAMGILTASEQIVAPRIEEYVMMGELSLDGGLQPVKGVLSMAIRAREEGFSGLIIPLQNAREAAVVDRLKIYGIENIREVIDFFNSGTPLVQTVVDTRAEFNACKNNFEIDFSEVKGQENVKRAFEISAAGSHNLILIGPPGAGKTMLAKRLSTILPPFTLKEALETTKIHSVAGKIEQNTSLMIRRPFRNPHHSISPSALVGGGSIPQPGEISLAHNGVLFLDELPEFGRSVLEVMRQPLEDRSITVSRAKMSVEFPASFMLIASMNPCPCGFYNHPTKQCVCQPGVVQKYLNRISGPLLDRIDIHLEVVPVAFNKISEMSSGESSETIRSRVVAAREIQRERFEETAIYANAQMSTRLLNKYCDIDKPGQALLKNAMEKLGLSARAYDRILKVARTIADLEGVENIQACHLGEAIQYRSLDREGWGA